MAPVHFWVPCHGLWERLDSSVSLLASEGYFGLITGLNGTKKNAFYTYQSEIRAGR